MPGSNATKRGFLNVAFLLIALSMGLFALASFAFVFNGLAIPIAAGVLYPAFGLLLNPMIASAAMSASSVLVIGNALRLRTTAL